MFTLYPTPNEFQVFYTTPHLRLRYRTSARFKATLLVLVLPSLFLFVAHCIALLWALHAVLSLKFSTAFQVLSYSTGHIQNIVPFILSFFVLSVTFSFTLWTLLGCKELSATPESLTLVYHLLGVSQEKTLLVRELDCFTLALISVSEGSIWQLSAIAYQPPNKRKTSLTISLYEHSNPISCLWLGDALSRFYNLEFRSAVRSRPKARKVEKTMMPR